MSMKERDQIGKIQQEIQAKLSKTYDKNFEEVNSKISGVNKKIDAILEAIKGLNIQGPTTVVVEKIESTEDKKKKFDTSVESFIPDIDTKGMKIKLSEGEKKIEEIDFDASLEALDEISH